MSNDADDLSFGFRTEDSEYSLPG
ncbi:hypothetical protein VCR14J2_610320 [Vibrio coralliirubri]|nr:hypothetical protein VCR14J2_610320 [Vibrio coralliirubri]